MNWVSKRLAASLVAPLVVSLPLLAGGAAFAADDEAGPASNPASGADQISKKKPTAPVEPGIHLFHDDLVVNWTVMGQMEWGSYSQTAAASALPATYGPNLEGGVKARRLQLTFDFQLFQDWDVAGSYRLVAGDGNFAGAWQTLGLQYNGLKSFSFRLGAVGLPTNLDGATATSATTFFERSAVSDLQRGLAGALGRYGASVLYGTNRMFGLLAVTGGRLNDHQPIDSQKAVLGRFSYMAISEKDTQLLVGVNATHIFELPPPATTSGGVGATDDGAGLSAASFASVPEFRLDPRNTSLLRTGPMPANHISQWGVEMAGNWRNFYVQSGYYDFQVDRAVITYQTYTSATAVTATPTQPSNNHFSGWYAQGS